MLAWEEHGSGPALALVHGIGSDRRRWDPLVERLADDFRCIAVDLPGHGASPAEGMDAASAAGAVQAVLEHLDAGPTTVVGHSLGATVALLHGAFYRPRSVVAIDPGHLHLPHLAETVAPFAERLQGDDFEQAFLEWERRAWKPDEAASTLAFTPRQDVVLAYWSTLLSPGGAERSQPVLEEVLRSLAVPALVCLGSEPTREDAAILASVRTASVEVFPGQGHWLHLRDPDAFAARLRRWHDALPQV